MPFITMLCATLALTAPAVAQTRFAWPDTAVDVSRYSSVGQCLAAVDRVRRGIARRDALTVWPDTLPPDTRWALEPAPPLVTETARRCAVRFDEPSADLTEFTPLLRLYLAADRESDAAALIARRMTAGPATTARDLAALWDSVANIYLSPRTQPMHLEAAEPLLLAHAHDGTVDRIGRMGIYTRIMSAARNVGDTTRARRAARWVVAVADSLTETERESEAFEEVEGWGGKLMVYVAMQELAGIDAVLDSLRRGTPAFVELARTMWSAGTGQRRESLPILGERAPTITADYWYPTAAERISRPTTGRASFVVLLDYQCLTWRQSMSIFGVQDSCAGVLANVRRLSERFPELDITIVARTRGSFAYAPPMTSAVEAGMIHTWLDSYRIPRLAVAITSTPFWNLPSPDGRRIDQETANRTRYSFGRASPAGLWSAEFLVDQDGIVVWERGFITSSATGFATYEDLLRFIDVLVHRPESGGGHASN